jgi:hypothetical protein
MLEGVVDNLFVLVDLPFRPSAEPSRIVEQHVFSSRP